MKMNLKNKKGFTTVDLSIAMIVVIIFAIIMTSISYSVYTSSMEAKRTAVALNYAVDIFERIGLADFSEVAATNELLKIDSLKSFEYKGISSNDGIDTITGSIGTYEINLRIQDYHGGGKLKIITLTITYPVSRKDTETLELQRIKTIKQ